MAGNEKAAKRAKKAHNAETTTRVPSYTYVHVDRLEEVNRRRIKLPACMMEQEIVDAVKHNDVVVITGDTGCGKSTQVPQFLYENGFCSGDAIVGVTQVRRVACLALYQQVSLELNSKTLVGYQYRFNRGYNQKLCKIKFMTDGILLQEIKEDLLCARYSVLIIDEAHERNLNCDLLIGVLSRVVQLRREQFESGASELPPLKLVIMSATIRAEDFLSAGIFGGRVAHQHIATEFKRNTIHFARRTVRDYVADAHEKVLKIHHRLPPGSVLVFLTGKDELYRLKRLLDTAPQTTATAAPQPSQPAEEPNDDDALFDLDSDDGSETEPDPGEPNVDGVAPPDQGGTCDQRLTADGSAQADIPIPEESQPGEPLSHLARVNETAPTIEVIDQTAEEDWGVTSNCSADTTDNADAIGDESNEDPSGDTHDMADTPAATAGRVIAGESDDEADNDAEGTYRVELEILSKSYKKLSDVKWHGAGAGAGRLRVVVMHASQTMDAQMAAFAPPADDERVVILSTNVAETAVTLPNIRYVVDCGKEKRRLDDTLRGVSRFAICDISKASADQRAGRAGRVGRGHCYRQYTSSVYETLFEDYSPVEVANCNLEPAILLLASIHITNPFDFPFLTRPPAENIRSALRALAVLGAIETPAKTATERLSAHNEVTTSPFKIPPLYPHRSPYEVLQGLRAARITQLGQHLALLPLHPRFGKMLYCVLSKGAGAQALRAACCVISALSFGAANLVTPRVPGDDPNRRPLPPLRSDVELFMWLCCRYSQATKTGAAAFCREYGVNERLLREAFQQAEQLHRALRSSLGPAAGLLEADWGAPLEAPSRRTKQIIEAAVVECLVDKVAVRSASLSGEAQAAAANAYRTGALVAARRDVFLPRPYARHKPECVVFGGLVGDEKVRMQDVLPTDAATLCTLRSPLVVADRLRRSPPPRYSPEADCVEAFVHRVYAPLEFSLGVAKAALNPDHPLATRVFAQQLCLGAVFPSLAPFSGALAVRADDFLAPAKASGPLGAMLLALRRARVSSRAAFLEARRGNVHFLQEEFCGLLRAGEFDRQLLARAFEVIA
ncbi:DEAD/DEAH box ATP-dependent RNA helicase, putative [Babesia caballi]|uniref:RNA helicase n=1 Tax=Babesia caballi TaxID=5871 RepID=A0AAV4LR81_BABCB|nr:DEAD/DEAH box ATP-dependent RNA helicase, putative [Babesia caballi]